MFGIRGESILLTTAEQCIAKTHQDRKDVAHGAIVV